MRIVSFSTSPHADRSFQIGLGLVVLFALAEFFAVSQYYLRQFRVARPAAATVTETKPVAEAKPTVAPLVAPPPVEVRPSPQAAAATTASHPAPAAAGVDRLVRDAVALRDKGDTTNALARLYQASEREPKNPKVLEEMAKTYESMQLFDRSSDTWQKIREIGPSAGPSYDLALARLTTGVATPGPVVAPTVAPVGKAEGAAAPAQESAGVLLAISQVTATEDPDPDSDTNLTLRVSIKKQPEAVLDHTKVRIQVYFYETVDELSKEIKLTDLQPTFEWMTRNHDWKTNEPEVLAVNYVRPKNKVTSSEAALLAAAASVNPGRKGKTATPSPASEAGRRRYLGYIVRVFYKDKLQAEKGEPRSLLKRFPASAPGSP